jgi:hypothetical protein
VWPPVLMVTNRGGDAFDLISLGHSMGAVFFGLSALLWEMPSHRFWEWGENGMWSRPTTAGELLVLSCSLLYFAVDALQLLFRHQTMVTLHRAGYLFHHALCAAGLLVPLLLKVDGTLVLCGLVVGEIANPPRLLSQLGERLARRRAAASGPLQRWALKHRTNLFTIHYGAFVVTRVTCVDLVVKVAYVHAQSAWTFGACDVALYLVVPR